MKYLKNKAKIVAIAIEILFFHMNMKLLAFPVDIMYLNEKRNSLKFNGKK